MLTKLTLTIDDRVVGQAKRFARNKNKSISRMVEEYLDNISEGKAYPKIAGKLNSPITDSLVGMFKDSDEDYKKMIEEAISEKHI
jgi:hypothetical protein